MSSLQVIPPPPREVPTLHSTPFSPQSVQVRQACTCSPERLPACSRGGGWGWGDGRGTTSVRLVTDEGPCLSPPLPSSGADPLDSRAAGGDTLRFLGPGLRETYHRLQRGKRGEAALNSYLNTRNLHSIQLPICISLKKAMKTTTITQSGQIRTVSNTLSVPLDLRWEQSQRKP